MTNPITYSIEVAWTGQLTGVFTIGTSTIGGTDVIAGYFGGNAFDDVTSDVKALTIARGRASDMSTMQQGRAVITLRDSDGTYNPENAGSALHDYLVPMRPVRIRATYAGTTYGLFLGYISRIEHNPDPKVRQTVIEAVDFFEWLSGAKPTIAVQTNKTVDYLIGLILDAVGWNDPNMRALGVSNTTIPSWSLAGGTSAISAIEILLRVDLGMFYIDGDGVATYLNRNTRYANGTPAVTLDGTYLSGLRTSAEKDRIINYQTVTKTGSTPQTASDAASRKAYGYRDGSPLDSAYLESDSVALSLAQFIVAMNAQPRSPGRQIDVFNRSAAAITQQLSREIGDLVTVSESLGGTAFTGRIQALQHQVTRAGNLHRATFVVQKISASAFTIGASTIGGADVIAY